MDCSTCRFPCPSPNPRAYSKSCPSSQCCHLAISPSVIRFSTCLQSFTASGSFPIESVLCVRWPMYWSFSFNISASNEYSGLITFRMDWLDLLAVQGTLKTLLQHHGSKETDANLPLSMQESPAEGWVGSGWLQCRGHSVQ